jgi:hypothetical protein
MKQLYQFIKDAILIWYGALSGIIFFAITILEHETGVTLDRWVFLLILIAPIFWAFFRTWKKQNDRVRFLETQLAEKNDGKNAVIAFKNGLIELINEGKGAEKDEFSFVRNEWLRKTEAFLTAHEKTVGLYKFQNPSYGMSSGGMNKEELDRKLATLKIHAQVQYLEWALQYPEKL